MSNDQSPSPSEPPVAETAATSRPSRGRRLLWVLAPIGVLLAVAGGYSWTQLRPALAPAFRTVDYTIPEAPRLVAGTGETVYRIDATHSEVTYAVDERIVGQSAHTAHGSTSGMAGDIAVNAADPAASRVGQIVVDVRQLHSDNDLRDARIRQDYLESAAHPLASLNVTALDGLPSATATSGPAHFTLTGDLLAGPNPTPTTWQGEATVAGGKLTATATTVVKMSALGIGPINLAGLVSTGDDVTLTMKLTALDPSRFPIPTEIAAPADAPHRGKSPSFKSAVQPILESSCASCHATGEVGAVHWKLDTAGDAAKVSDGLGTVVQAKYMPPWPASNVGVPLGHAKTLDAKQVATIVQWAKAGGKLDVPATTKVKATPSKGSAPRPRHDVELKMPDAYTGSTSNRNDYRCFVLDPHFTAATYVTGYEVTPDHREEIHHAQIFHIDAGQASAGLAKYGADGQPGWSCYAGPGLASSPPAPGAPRPRRLRGFTGQGGLIAGWVPGQDPVIYPESSGVLFQPGDALVLQIHYHYEGQPVADRSTVSLQTSPGTDPIKPLDIINPIGPVEIPCSPGADSAPLCNRDAALADDGQLYGPAGSLIEPGLLALCGKTADQLAANYVDGVAHTSCDYRVPEAGQIVTAMGHMHTLGKSFRLTLDPGTPNQKVLLDIPRWNFDWQMNYDLAKPLHVTTGQTIRMECSWDRSLDPNRAPKYIVFAEGTEDEMCFSTYAIIPDNP